MGIVMTMILKMILTMILVNHHYDDDDDYVDDFDDVDDDIINVDDGHRKSKERPPLLLRQKNQVFCPVRSFQDEVAHSVDLPEQW